MRRHTLTTKKKLDCVTVASPLSMELLARSQITTCDITLVMTYNVQDQKVKLMYNLSPLWSPLVAVYLLVLMDYSWLSVFTFK